MNERDKRMRKSMRGSALADNVATSKTAHCRGMRDAGGNVTAIAGAVEMWFAVNGKGHLSAENDMSGFGNVCVIGILRIWPIGPNVGVGKTFTLQLRCEPSFVLHLVQPFVRVSQAKQLRPLIALNWR